jgi:hypothetical protein
MPASHTLDRLAVTFDDAHAVADAGLILPATLAQHLGLRDPFDTHVDLGSARGHANVGHKAMTFIHSALAGGGFADGVAVTIDVDSSIVETYGLAKQGGAKFTYNDVRGYHSLWSFPHNGCCEAPRIMLRGRLGFVFVLVERLAGRMSSA